MPTNNSVNARFPDTPDGSMSLGSASVAQTITIGNTTGATSMALRYGTAGYILSSAGGNTMVADSSGHVTFPRQPAFQGRLSSDVLNVTGNGGVYTVGSGTALTETFDQNGDFTTAGVFTAPVTGVYMLTGVVRSLQLSAAMTNSLFSISTSNRSYSYRINIGAIRDSNDEGSHSFTTLADMDAADTATFNLTVTNGAGNTADIDGIATSLITGISGYLVA